MNLQSEGHGISGFETMLSIGLGQDQQFTLILQTLQQLRDVYGESVDKIVQGNTSNIVFLKSTDDSMLDTLQKMSGTTHKSYIDGKTVTRDEQSFFKMTQNEGKISYTLSTKEQPVISYNDMAFISERNSIVFRAGDSPIWNRNETILPMSWRLFKNTIIQPGKEYTLQTIPTLSTAMDFDVRKNQPNFIKMLDTRMEQAFRAADMQKKYQDSYKYSDYDIAQLDPDVYSDEIMDLIYMDMTDDETRAKIKEAAATRTDTAESSDEFEEVLDFIFGNQDVKNNEKFKMNYQTVNDLPPIEENNDQLMETAKVQKSVQGDSVMRYAGKTISRDMIVSKTGVNHGLDETIVRVYKSIKDQMDNDTEYFIVRGGSLCSANNGNVYIKNLTNTDNIDKLNEAARDDDARVYSDAEITAADANAIGSYEVTDHFLRFLSTFNSAWPFANGAFEDKMRDEMKA